MGFVVSRELVDGAKISIITIYEYNINTEVWSGKARLIIFYLFWQHDWARIGYFMRHVVALPTFRYLLISRIIHTNYWGAKLKPAASSESSSGFVDNVAEWMNYKCMFLIIIAALETKYNSLLN